MKRLNPLTSRPEWSDREKKTDHFSKDKFRSPGWSSGNTPQPLPEMSAGPRTRREIVAAAAAKADKRITIKVVGGAGGAKRGTYTMPFEPRAKLSDYFKKIGLIRVAAKGRVYDMTYFKLGRRRLNYVPKEDSVIQIGHSNYTPVNHLQRSNDHDGMNLAKNMGGGAQYVEVDLASGHSSKNGTTERPRQPVDDLDVDQF